MVVLPDLVVVDTTTLDRLRLIKRTGLYGAIEVPVAVLLHVRFVYPIVLDADMETRSVGLIGHRLGIRQGHGSQERNTN